MNQMVVEVGGRIFFTCWWSFLCFGSEILTFLAKVDVCLASPMDSCFISGCR